MPRSRRAAARILLGAIVCAALPGPALSQTIGTVRGTVRDDAGAPVAGVSIVVASASQGINGRAAVSDSSGSFQVASLPPAGDYVVHATFPGFASVSLSEVEIRAGQATSVRLTLPAGAYRERVEVRARPQVVSLEETTTETRFASEFIDALPILGRNYQDILALAPGVSDVDGDGNPNIHGARDTDVITLVDGVSTTDPLTGKIGAQLNIESIQEIEIKTSGATAEFGRAQGGFANIITKSGGNEFEGAFKFFWRGSRLDGDGAGIDDPLVSRGGEIVQIGRPDLEFNDFLPFLSLGGPIVMDRAWFFTASEYVQKEEPVNAITRAFVTGTREFREFVKLTWQAAASHRLALSFNYDPQEYTNLGLNSFTREETGFTDRLGGTLLAARATSILTPNVALETTLSQFDGRPERIPNTGPDLNGDGILFRDFNDDGFRDYVERDFGEDWDGDGRYDVFEPRIENGQFLSLHDDRDGDFRRTLPGECEGRLREDLDCDGHLDRLPEDRNGNGRWDEGEFDYDGDGRLELGNEDRNNNRRLDDTPFPAGLYPYGSLKPLGPDWEYTLDQKTGLTGGPFHQTYDDRRRRFGLRQDLSVYVPEARGSHDLKAGLSVERETYGRDLEARQVVGVFVPDHEEFPIPFPNHPRYGVCGGALRPCPDPIRVVALLPTQEAFAGEATGTTTGLYLQDSYKPIPNLSLGLGVRFDRETAEAPGFTFFDPLAARIHFDRLNALIGSEALYDNELLFGDANGVVSFGILRDPFYAGAQDVEKATADLTDPIRRALPTLFMRNHSDVLFGSDVLANLLPDIIRDGRVDSDLLTQAGVETQVPEPFRIANNNLAPRLSISWDPLAAGKTKLFATWGRYYDKLFLNTLVGEQGPDYVTRYYEFSNLAYRDLVQPHHLLGDAVSSSPPSANQIDRGLATPFSDEFTCGFEREIAPETALSVTFIDRRFRKQLQDVDVNHSLHYDTAGRPLDFLGRQVRLEDPERPGAFDLKRVPDGRPDLYIRNPFFNQVLRVGNYNEASYRAFEIELRRRLARRWQMQASYAYSRATGDAEDFQSRLGNDPSTTEFESGYLSYDQRHVVKLNAMTYLPGDWQLGTAVSWSSGLPYSTITRFFALDSADYQQFRTRFGYVDTSPGGANRFVAVRRNSQRNDPVLDVNVRARKTVVIGRTTAALAFEIFNLLNSDDLRVITYEQTPDASTASISLQTPLPAGAIQLDATRRFGRRFQVGIQFEF